MYIYILFVTDGSWQSLKPAIFHDSKSRKAFRDLLGVSFWRAGNFLKSLNQHVYFRDPRSRNKLSPLSCAQIQTNSLDSHDKLGVLLGAFNHCI